jgi:hypothetical protein
MAICGCGLPAAAVSLLLLEALFMQISGVSLALTWPCRLCLLRVLLCTSRCYKLSPFQAHWGRWQCTRFLRPACLFTVRMGSGSSPVSCGVFLPLPLLQAFPILIAGRVLLLLLAAMFVYSSHGKFCLFLVALPARCVSTVSPRSHFRRLAFCFLPLAAILESLFFSFFKITFVIALLFRFWSILS